MKKQYVVRKYVMAENVEEAIKKEKRVKAEEIFIDDDWKKANPDIVEKPIKGLTK